MNTPQHIDDQSAIRRMVQHAGLESPSQGFAARVMQRITAKEIVVSKRIVWMQYALLSSVACVVLLMLVFPAWSVIEIDPAMAGSSAAQMAGSFFSNAAHSINAYTSQIHLNPQVAYFFPLSIAVLVVALFDQVISRKMQAAQ